MIKPKFSFNDQNKKFKITEKFIDRTEPLRLFLDSLKNSTDKYRILMFYGIGGIGKSSLKSELMRLHQSEYKEDHIAFNLDFNIAENRNSSDGILSIADSCKGNKKVNFHLFELAYALYFKKKYPASAYNREKERLVSKFGIGFGIVSIFDSGITQTALSIIETVIGSIRNMTIDETIRADLEQFDSLPLKDIEERLPAYLAYDIQEFKKKNPGTKVVFYLDTFEALNAFESDRIHNRSNERWIQDFIAYFPGDLFVLFGRDKLTWTDGWEPYIKTLELKDFDGGYAGEYLRSGGIAESEIINKIIRSCGGYPFYLSLSLETYADIVNSDRTPKPEDFGKDYPEIIERFVNNLNAFEIETLKIISVPNYYTKEIFELLIKNFNIGYSTTLFSKLNSYSFVMKDKDRYYIHEIMKNGLKNFFDHEYLIQVHEKMLEYYEGLFITGRSKEGFSELIYHKIAVCDYKDFHSWLYPEKFSYLQALQLLGEQSAVISMISMIINRYGMKDIDLSLINMYVDIVHLGGNYREAVSICEDYLQNYSADQIINNEELLKMAVRKIHHSMFWSPAEPLINEAKSLLKYKEIQKFKEARYELLFLVGGNLGFLYGDLAESEKWLKESMDYAISNGLRNNELRTARKQIDLLCLKGKLHEALEYSKQYIKMDSELESRYRVYLIGALGEIYRRIGSYNEAVYCLERLEKAAKERNVIGWQAHAYLALALLHLQSQNYETAKSFLNKAELIYNKIEQAWGQINSRIVHFLILLNSGEKTTEDLKGEIEEVRLRTVKMQYRYYAEILAKILEKGDASEFHLLFL